MRGIRILSVLLTAVLVVALMPAAAFATPPAMYYPVRVQYGAVSAENVQVYNGVTYVKAGDTVTVTAALPAGLFSGNYDYSSQVFAYWVAEGIILADTQSPSVVFSMPGNAVTLEGYYKTPITPAPAHPENPFRDFSATLDISNDHIGVSYTPARDFAVELMGSHDPSQYADIDAGSVEAAIILKRAMLVYEDARNVFTYSLSRSSGFEYLEKAFKTRDKYLTIPGTGEEVLLCEENWNRIVDDYFAVRFTDLHEQDLAALKNMRFFERLSGGTGCVIEYLSRVWGDPSAAMRDVDVLMADLAAYRGDLDWAMKKGLTEDLLERVKLELGNSFYYEVYYVDGGGNEVNLKRYQNTPTDDVTLRKSFGQIGSAWLNHCQATFNYQKDVAEEHGYTSPEALRSIADKVRVRFVTDEVLTSAGVPFVTNYTNVIVPVPSVLGVSGITPDKTYNSIDTAVFSTQTENLFEGEPSEGDLCLLPISWCLDDSTPTTFAGTFEGTVDMSGLSRGDHKLTVNFVYQAYTGGVWVNKDTVVPYNVSFQVSKPYSKNTHTLTDKATGVTVSGNIHSQARLAVSALKLHPEGTCVACDEIRRAQADGQMILGYDISLTQGFYGSLTISMPVGDQYDGQTVNILHCINRTMETITATVVNGKATFSVAELSPFAVTTDLLAPASVVTDPPKTGDSSSLWALWLLFGSTLAGFAVFDLTRRRLKG